MSLRELLLKTNYKLLFNKIHKLFLSNLPKNKVIEADVAISSLIKHGLSSTQSNDEDYKIYITSANSTIDVCIFNETEDSILPLDDINLLDIIDMEIYKAIKISDDFAIAHILNKIHNNGRKRRVN